MDYGQALDYLYQALPMFTRDGASAIKPGLKNILALCQALGNPHKKLKVIHIAGTNGKGSTSHALASILQHAGYKTGLHTSPHLKSYTERFRINGVEVDEQLVAAFVSENITLFEEINPSFFEISVAYAFYYFAQQQVDVAIMETGMGGRWDSTNIVTPILAVITNISYDHTQFLGDTLEKIAGEKAGIIKSGIPVVISERQPESAAVFIEAAKANHAPITFAQDMFKLGYKGSENHKSIYEVQYADGNASFTLTCDLQGSYQLNNLTGVLAACEVLNSLGLTITRENVISGIAGITTTTGLKGRWQILGNAPLQIADTGHNEAGIKLVVAQLEALKPNNLIMVMGFVKDKDISTILTLLPRHAHYIFCQASLPRALNASELQGMALLAGLHGESEPDVNKAYAKALALATPNDVVYIGGSTFVVAALDIV